LLQQFITLNHRKASQAAMFSILADSALSASRWKHCWSRPT